MGILPGADKCQQKDVKRQQLLPGLFIPPIPTEAHKEFTRNPHGTLFIKTNKRALAAHNQLPSRSILALCLSSSSFRIGGSADGSYFCPSAGASVIFPSRFYVSGALHQQLPDYASSLPRDTQGWSFQPLFTTGRAAIKAVLIKPSNISIKEKPGIGWRWHLWETERRNKGVGLQPVWAQRNLQQCCLLKRQAHFSSSSRQKQGQRFFFPGVSVY